MVPEKRQIKTILRREIVRALAATQDPELMAKLTQQLIDVLGVSKAAKATGQKGAKGAKKTRKKARSDRA